MDLRAKIAEAARSIPIHLGPNAIANAQAGHALRLSGGEADQVADAVMGVIEAEHGGPKCVSANIYDQVCGQMHDAHEEAQAAKGRVRELEAEHDEDAGVIRALRRQRDQAEAALEAATGFEFRDPAKNRPAVAVRPDGPSGCTDSWAVVVLEADRDTVEAIELDLKAALARAREITKEEQ